MDTHTRRSVGVKLSLTELWQRRDYTPERYDPAWSFATFLVEQFGQERYFDFYRSHRRNLTECVPVTLGASSSQIEREWHQYTRAQVSIAPSQIARLHRSAGVVCGRAAWLGRQPNSIPPGDSEEPV